MMTLFPILQFEFITEFFPITTFSPKTDSLDSFSFYIFKKRPLMHLHKQNKDLQQLLSFYYLSDLPILE
ncbi:MAG: hypothetical protein CM15mP22_8260 [Gammaproteobacteria bacterium]|nr:MAG: hypothetical protein CM15mP22_8260 [Gammaproteobacteria bacterium]